MAYGGTPPYQYFWDFGDGNISRLKNPRHTYLRSGDYTVTLVVTDHTGQTNTSITTTSIEVGVQAFGPSLGLLNETIKFSGSAFAGFPPYTWEWNFGDGNVSHSQNTLHNYSRARIYNVTLTVTDSQQNKGNTTIYIRIASPFVYVDDDAPLGGDGSHAHPFNNITLALIEVADPGTVYVNNGTYVEFLYINKSVTLRAESREHTILDGFENPDSILVNHNNVTIQNFTIFNTSTGISIIDSSNIKISDNILTHTYTGYGIQTYNVTKCTITHNTLSSYFYGILIQSSSDISVEDNVLSSHRYAGIQLQDTTTISILRNTITESGQYGISLIIDFGETHHNIVKENIISGCYWKGIILTGSHNNTISNNICFSNSENDIVLEESSNNIVQNNVCSYTNCGIYLTFLSNENIIENNICRSNINYGLYIQNSYYNTIQNNVFENCSLFLDGNQETFTYQEISGNTVNDKPIYYYKNSNLDNASAPDDAGEIILVNCSWFTIEHTLFTHTNTAVLIAYSSHITLNDNMFLRQNSFHLYLLSAHNISMTNNTFSVSGWIGMRFYSSSYLTFSRNRINLTWTGIEASACSHSSFMDNVFENMNQGIGLDSSHDCIIANNSISGIPETDYVFGLYISYSHDNCISSNTIVGNAYGIAFWNSSRNICEKNVITNNRYSGISFKCFWGSCEDNVLRENTIAFNNHGIKIDPNTVNTLIYHNNFINNTVNAYDTCSNSWNHSSLFGNYWSDYNGTDGNGDGIGDIAYDIPPEGLNKDYAPFMVRDGWLLR